MSDVTAATKTDMKPTGRAYTTTVIASLYVVEPHSRDVLLGRGSRIDQYPGNLQYRVQVAKRKEAYASTSDNEQKKEIADLIIAGIAERGGRFLRRVATSSEEATMLNVPEHLNVWVEIDHATAVEKTKQALREKGAAGKRNMARKLEGASAVVGKTAVARSLESFDDIAQAGGATSGPSLDHFAATASSNKPIFQLPQASRSVASYPNATNSLLATSHGGNMRELQLLQSLVARSHQNIKRNSMTATIAAPLSTTQSIWLLQRQLDRQDLERRTQQERLRENALLQQQMAVMRQRQLERLIREQTPVGGAFHTSVGGGNSAFQCGSLNKTLHAVRNQGFDSGRAPPAMAGGPSQSAQWSRSLQAHRAAPVLSNPTAVTRALEGSSSALASWLLLSQSATQDSSGQSLQQLLNAIQQGQRQRNEE